MTTSLLLVHAPLVGPSTWAALAERAAARGHAVAVPDLTGVATATPPRWRWFAEHAAGGADAVPEPVVVIGHSGAGAYLPLIGAQLGAWPAALVFVDAIVPPATGAHRTSPGLRSLLDERTVDGRLLPWLDWWPEDTVAELLPDPADRALLAADLPRLPRDLYDEVVPVPDGWAADRCAYLQLSPAYDAEFQEAGARGWPRRRLAGTHLSIHTDAEVVLDAVVGLLGEVDDPGDA